MRTDTACIGRAGDALGVAAVVAYRAEPRSGLMKSTSVKSRSLSVTTTQSVGLRRRRDDHVERVAGTTRRRAFSHEPRPHEARLPVKGEDTTGEYRRRTIRACEPHLELVTLPARLPLQHAAADLGDSERGDEEVVISLGRHPGEQRRRRRGLGDVADYVGVDFGNHNFATGHRVGVELRSTMIYL